MAFQKGKPRPANAGRKKGALNQDKRIVRDIVEKALGKSLPDEIVSTLHALEDDEKARTLLGLMPYCYPKLQSVEVSGPNGADIGISMKPKINAILSNPEAFAAMEKIADLVNADTKPASPATDDA